MTGVALTRGNVAPGTVYSGTEVLVGRVNIGDAIHLRCRYAEALINATTAPALQQWEGPYVRLYPVGDRYSTGLIKNSFLSNAQYAWAGGTVDLDAVASTNTSETLFYELDAIGNPPIYCPFEAEVSLFTYLSGVWLFDLMIIPAALAHQTQHRMRYAQTRTVAANAARRFIEVPMGATELSPIGIADNNSMEWDFEEQGKVVGNGSSQIFNQLWTAGAPYDNVLPTAGARRIGFNGTAIRAAGVTFWINLG